MYYEMQKDVEIPLCYSWGGGGGLEYVLQLHLGQQSTISTSVTKLHDTGFTRGKVHPW